MPDDIISVTVRVTETLEKFGIPYFVGGSVASTLYGMIRTTQDSDIIASLKEEHIPLLVKALHNDFYIDDLMAVNAISHFSSFNIIHQKSMIKVDIFIPHPSPFIQMEFKRARKELLSSDSKLSAFIASPEDIILAKLQWYRIGGETSERQWRDILGVLKVQGKALDISYLKQMAEAMKVNDLLEKVIV